MKLNHINLTVDDVPAAHDFLQTYFGLQSMSCNKHIGLMKDDDGAIITLMGLKLANATEVRYPNSFHIGFIQETDEQVNTINQRLRDAGYDVAPPSRQHGAWTFYFQAPGGFVIEVQH